MSRQPSDKLKRRAPAESPKDDRQDADWGFQPTDEGLGVEKKLGFVLVICLLAGFGFVLYQKYRILQRDAAQVEHQEPPAGEPSGAEPQGPALVLEPEPAPTVESPFYEAPDETLNDPSPTQAADEQWILASEETPPASPAAPVALPSTHEESSDEFNPFVMGDGAAPPEPDAASEPTDAPAITWNDEAPPASSAQEPAPFEWEDGLLSGDRSRLDKESNELEEPSPFAVPEPGLAEAPLPSAEPEPVADLPPLDPGDAGDSAAGTADESSAFVIDPAPVQQEPESLPSPPGMVPLADDVPSQDEPAESAAAFDPFSDSEPTSSPTVDASPPEPLPFPDTGAAAQPSLPEPVPGATNETPEWPFSDTEESTASEQWEPPPQQDEPPPVDDEPVFGLEPAESPAPSAANEVRQQPSSGWDSTDPFSGNAASEPVATSIVSMQAVFGEREVVVTESDSFWSISEREYGTSRYFTALAQYNRDRVDQPERLQSGVSIRIPPPEVLEAKFPEMFQHPRTAQEATITPLSGSQVTEVKQAPSGLFFDERLQRRYRVGQRDTLSTIAQQHLGRATRWPEIFELNRDQLSSPSTLKIGMVLKLPPDTDEAIVWPEHDTSR